MDQNAPLLKTSTGDIFQISSKKIKLRDKISIILHVCFNYL